MSAYEERRRRREEEQRPPLRPIDARMPDAKIAGAFGYTSLERDMSGNLIAGTHPVTGQKVKFVNGMPPESNGGKPEAIPSSPTSTARAILDNAPSARDVLNRPPVPPSVQFPGFDKIKRIAQDAADTGRAATGAQPIRRDFFTQGSNPIAGTPEAVNAALHDMVAASSRDGTRVPASPTPAPAPSVADAYRSGSSYNTLQATRDYTSGKISAADLAHVQATAAKVGDSPDPAPVSYFQPLGRQAGSARIIPTTPNSSVVASDITAPDGTRTVTNLAGGTAVIPAAQPQSNPGGTGIVSGGVPVVRNPAGSLVAANSPSAAPKLDLGSNFKGVHPDVQASLVAKYPGLAVAGSDDHNAFVSAIRNSGSDGSDAATLADRLFASGAQPMQTATAAPTKPETPFDPTGGYASGLGSVAKPASLPPTPAQASAARVPGSTTDFSTPIAQTRMQAQVGGSPEDDDLGRNTGATGVARTTFPGFDTSRNVSAPGAAGVASDVASLRTPQTVAAAKSFKGFADPATSTAANNSGAGINATADGGALGANPFTKATDDLAGAVDASRGKFQGFVPAGSTTAGSTAVVGTNNGNTPGGTKPTNPPDIPPRASEDIVDLDGAGQKAARARTQAQQTAFMDANQQSYEEMQRRLKRNGSGS